MRRDTSTIFFVLVVPSLQLMVFGYAIDTQIEHIPVAVYDLDGRQEGRRLAEAMVATRSFTIAERPNDAESFRRSLTSGRVKAGVIIPADYSERLLRGEQATVQVLVDGSDSQVATTAMNTVSLLTTQMSIGRAKAMGESLQVAAARSAGGQSAMPIEARVRLLYNPNLESSHFFVPGLIAIIMQLVLVFLTSFSIVKEREAGTLEQLFVTPVGRGATGSNRLICLIESRGRITGPNRPFCAASQALPLPPPCFSRRDCKKADIASRSSPRSLVSSSLDFPA